jgi:hypothetical protein
MLRQSRYSNSLLHRSPKPGTVAIVALGMPRGRRALVTILNIFICTIFIWLNPDRCTHGGRYWRHEPIPE